MYVKEYSFELFLKYIIIANKCYILGIPDIKGLRAQCWKLLLGYLDTDRSSWMKILSRKRALYKQFIEELVLPPGLHVNAATRINNKDDDISLTKHALDDHPLNEGPDSAWNTFFNDNEILLQIDKDVRRLCPDISFFQQPTDFPCEIVVHSKGERRLHQRVVPPALKSANVERKGLGITKVRKMKMVQFYLLFVLPFSLRYIFVFL